MRSTDRSRLPRRSTDWFEDVAAWLLATLAVFGLGIALTVGMSAVAAGMQRARVESVTWIPAVATLVADAPLAAESPTGMPRVQTLATVSWTAPDGTRRVGEAVVGVGTRAGATVPIWLTGDGRLTSAPITPSGAVAVGMATGFAVLAVAACVVAAGWWITRRLTLALNVRAWEREWALTEPRWRGPAGSSR
jgi:hypothetical protein